jgi:hypothetical protein
MSQATSSTQPADPGRSIHDSMDGEASPAPQSAQPRRYVNRARGPLPPMPKIGLPEETYLHVAHKAERNGDDLVFEAAKVGQYVSLALRDTDAPWHVKLKYFRHALKRHCQAPEHADEMTKGWFTKLAHMIKAYAGAEALRLAAEVDEMYEARQSMGQDVEGIADDAEKFFEQVCPMCESCPPIYNEEDWVKLKGIRDRWI